jgi:selenocysteine-specific elongation factor
MRTAVNLPELELETDIQRGDVLTTPGFETSAALGVVLEKSPRFGEHTLKNRAQVYLHHGTARVRARVVFVNNDAIRRGERALAQLRLDSAVVAFLGDRFVLRDPSERFTIAGGVVLEPDGSRDAELLEARAAAPNDVDLCVRTEIKRLRATPISSLLHRSHFGADEVNAAVQRLNIPLRNELAIDPEHWNRLRACAADLIDQAHRQFPGRTGLELNELRTALGDEPPELVDALLADLCANEFVRARSTIARQSHRPALPPDLRAIAQKILELLSAKPFDPPARKLIAPDSKSQQALRFLIENGDIVEIGPDAIVSAKDFAKMKNAVVAFISKNGLATVSDLRQDLQTSRRIIVPFLEQLDAQKLTRRVGDKRLLA